MRIHYYVHVFYYNPGIYSYEYIIDMDKIDKFIGEIFSIVKDNYEEIFGSEELNFIDIGGWDDFLEENNIDYNYDDFFPYEKIWNFIKTNIENMLNSKETDEFKYDAFVDLVRTYLEMVEDANFFNGEYLIEINLFRDSRNFAKYFFKYFEDMSNYRDFPSYIKDRISYLKKFTEEHNFPNSDYHEGMLGEWVLIFNSICEEYYG